MLELASPGEIQQQSTFALEQVSIKEKLTIMIAFGWKLKFARLISRAPGDGAE